MSFRRLTVRGGLVALIAVAELIAGFGVFAPASSGGKGGCPKKRSCPTTSTSSTSTTSTGPTTTTTTTTPTTTVSSADPVIAAAGDICDSPTNCAPTAALIGQINPTRV